MVRYSANEKNQRMTFWANEGDSPTGAPILRYFTQDEWGNRYMMMASGGATVEETLADFTAAVLPDGWKKWLGYLPETVTVAPAYGADDQAQFNIWRDSGDNTHVQIHWSSSGHGIAEQIAGMPIWGGERSNLHYGTAGDDLIHGAGGDDTIVALGGDDTIHGDAGTDTVVLEGSSADYVDTSIYGHGSFHEFIGLGTTKLLYDVEFVRFADVTCSVKPSWRCPPRRILGPRQRLLPHG